jgi:HD-GYP domain-containing protein (c-di-GMP phosphodiesterase class II)
MRDGWRVSEDNDRATNGGIELRLSEVLSGLSYALDMTEGQARGHSERSCLIGMRLASALDLDDATRSSLFYALLLKDAGCSSNAARVAALVGVDDAMVKSSRRLTDTASSVQALLHVFRTAGAGAHHERLDGSGYYQGLTAAQLDRPSRILAVADVAEALSADRSYRRALSPDEVLGVLRLDAGSRLDAEVVAALGDVLPEWRSSVRPDFGQVSGVVPAPVRPEGSWKP